MQYEKKKKNTINGKKYTFHKKTWRNRRNKLLSPVIAVDLWWGGILLSHKIKVMIDIRDSNRNRNVILLPNCVGNNLLNMMFVSAKENEVNKKNNINKN